MSDNIELLQTVTASKNSGFNFIVFNVGGIDHRHFYLLHEDLKWSK